MFVFCNICIVSSFTSRTHRQTQPAFVPCWCKVSKKFPILQAFCPISHKLLLIFFLELTGPDPVSSYSIAHRISGITNCIVIITTTSCVMLLSSAAELLSSRIASGCCPRNSLQRSSNRYSAMLTTVQGRRHCSVWKMIKQSNAPCAAITRSSFPNCR